MGRCLVLLAVMVFLAGAAPPAVDVRLVCGDDALVPGRTVNVALVMTVPDGWHTYWDGLNDSGFPPRLTWTLPAGVTAGEPAWPPPHRHISAGEILDHVLDGEVVAVVPVTVAADVKTGGEVALACRVDWLACRDICVPGRTDTSLELPVTTAAAVRPEPAGAGVIAAAAARLPRPGNGAVRGVRNANILTITVPGARSLVFMPAGDSARPVNLLQQGAATGDRLELALRSEDATRPVRGVLAVETVPRSAPTHWLIDIPAEVKQ